MLAYECDSRSILFSLELQDQHSFQHFMKHLMYNCNG